MIDIKEAADFQKRREKAEEARCMQLLDVARHDFECIVDMIIKKYKPHRIYQWGSLLKDRHFRPYSDIDIAIEGTFSADAFFAMYGEAEAMTSFSLDLVDMNHIEPEFADIIRMKGRLIYDCPDTDCYTC